MFKSRFSVTVCSSFLISALAFGQSETSSTEVSADSSPAIETTTVATETPPAAQESASKYLVGLRSTSFVYEEPSVMNSKGLLTGAAASYFYQVTNGVLLRADGEFLTGKTQYRGSLSDFAGKTIPYSSEDRFRIMNFSTVGVVASNFTSSFVTAPFLGFGYRNTFDDKDGKYDYRRDITYYYLIYGLQFEVMNTQERSLILQAELNNMISGRCKTYLSDVNSKYPDLDLKQKSGMAYGLGLEYFHTLKTGGKLLTGLAYKKWQVPESEYYKYSDNLYFVEPENTTSLTSVTVGYLF